MNDPARSMRHRDLSLSCVCCTLQTVVGDASFLATERTKWPIAELAGSWCALLRWGCGTSLIGVEAMVKASAAFTGAPHGGSR
jgi:hypothetical protein